MRKVFSFGAATDQGDWPVQEDAYWIDPIEGVFVLADGFGGRGAGDRAAASVAAGIGETILKAGTKSPMGTNKEHPFLSPEEWEFHQALDQANQRLVVENLEQDPELRGGVSVMVARFLSSGRAILGGVGACGAAVLRQGRAIPILIPHSLAAQSREPLGGSDPSFGRDFPLQFLGLLPKVDPEIRTFHFLKDDKLILFTDGFTWGHSSILDQSALLFSDGSNKGLEAGAREVLELSRGSVGRLRNSSVVLVDCRAGTPALQASP